LDHPVVTAISTLPRRISDQLKQRGTGFLAISHFHFFLYHTCASLVIFSWEKNNCFESEIMTNIVNTNSKLSRITIGALDDMGYTVDYNAADDYTRRDLGKNCVCGGRKQKVRHLSSLDGDTSSPHPPNNNMERRLSEIGYQDAVAQGLSFLNTMEPPLLDGKSDGALAQGKYVGDKSVFVYYIEDNQVYSVYVEPE